MHQSSCPSINNSLRGTGTGTRKGGQNKHEEFRPSPLQQEQEEGEHDISDVLSGMNNASLFW